MKTFKYSLFFAVLVLFTSITSHAQYVEGKHYIPLTEKQQFTLSRQPEVVEFFYYGCPFCNRIHPMVKKWLKTKPKGVDFHYLPAYYSPNTRWSVQLYQVAFLLKKHLELQGKIFDKYSSKKLKTQQDIYDLFASVGVDQATVDKTYASFALKNLTKKSKDLTEKSGIEGVPSFIVKGKYRVSPTTAGGMEETFDVINYLLRKK